MLWTDRRIPISEQDLADIDSQIVDIIAAEQLPAKRIIAQALQETTFVVQSMMQSPVGVIPNTSNFTAAHLQAVFNTGLGMSAGVQAARIMLSQVVVTGPLPGALSHFRSWVLYRALAALMRDACERKDSDRYKVKWDRIEEHIARTAEPMLYNNGLPIVGAPLRAPAAEMEPDGGAFDASDLSTVAAVGALGGEYDVAVTWVGPNYVSQSRRNNAESAQSPAATLQIPAGQALAVSIARLPAPAGTFHDAYLATANNCAPMQAVGWNLWAGLHGSPLTLQNAQPFPVTLQSVALAGDPADDGAPAHEGQYSEVNLQIQRSIWRG